MISNYAYTPAILPSFVTVLLLIVLSIYSWPRRNVPGALPFAIGCLFAALWAAGSGMEAAAVDVQTKIFWFKFQGLWHLPAATATTCFVLEYAWPGRWLTRRNLVLLSIPCLVAFGLIITDDFHRLIWRGLFYDGTVVPLRGPGNWAFVAYGFALLGLINLIVFAWLFLRSPQHRWPVAIMLTGMLVGRAYYMLEAARLIQSDLLMYMPQFAFEYLIYAIALFGFRIFDSTALARQAVIAQMREGMLVLDLQDRVTSMNPAAERILGEPAGRLIGQPVNKLLPAGSIEEITDTEEAEIELSLEAGQEIRHYVLETSLLKDWRGLAMGRLLLLHDVTIQKQAQAHLLEQQRALAMLHEREQLARELHDSTAQVLGYAGFQLDVVHQHIMDGRAALSAEQAADAHTHLEKAEDQLTRLSSNIKEAHADVREYILNLRSAPSDKQPFFAALQHYLDGFSQNYNIQTGLSVESGLTEGKFDPGAQMQLFRIIQETLSNARKHSEASRVQITFETQDDFVRIIIRDNGCGFDPALAVDDGHFGLRFMHERAAQMGGNLQVQSSSGAGTCVVVDLPIASNQREEGK